MCSEDRKKEKTYAFVHRAWYLPTVLYAVLAVAGCDRADLDQPQGERAEVVYAKLAEEKVVLLNEFPGRVSALVSAEVRPQVDGIILERLFEEGADVVQGQVLYQIDPAAYEAAYNTAKAVLEEAEASVVALALLEKRYRNLISSKAVGQQDLDNAIAEHGQARARIARARAELESAAINLAYTQVKAPVSGRIGRSSVTPGALVTASQPDALAIIRQTGSVHVDFTQPSADMLRLRRAIAQNWISRNGGSAKVRLFLEDGTPYTRLTAHQTDSPEWITGDLLFSEISVSQTTGSVTLRAVFPNPDGLLLPGMYVRVIIEEGALENAICIPQSSALSNGSRGHFVYLLRKEDAGDEFFQVERREITLARTLGNRWIVKSGLAPDELLVVEGLQKVIPGEPVSGIPVKNAASGIDSARTKPEAR
ncbi:MAG: efflux RND transporter periplasmic adaptor subunit [Desulfovibrio sp.]|jgi:membrane fusion protein (multidrug efflux system)|nr:efflux RND transporter periplasmic adaptor subunit [Desulfovibrio sp.]